MYHKGEIDYGKASVLKSKVKNICNYFKFNRVLILFNS